MSTQQNYNKLSAGIRNTSSSTDNRLIYWY